MIPEGGVVLPVDKPEGPTSHDVVVWARRGLGVRRIGHTGTLDPFASGLLLLCLGPATRLAEYLSGLDKEYIAEVLLGVTTDTLDREGEILEQSVVPESLNADLLKEALERFVGEIDQIPPQFSAKKVDGERMYRKARRGEVTVLPPVRVTVRELELLTFDPPRIRLRIVCSSGTYIRAIARDLGEVLGVGAHLTALRRTAVGTFRADEGIPGEALRSEEGPAAASEAWITPAAALAHLPHVNASDEEVARLRMGQRIPVSGDVPVREPLAILGRGELVGVGESDGTLLRPRKVLPGA